MDKREIEVRQATVEDLDLPVPLFGAYRQFYPPASRTRTGAARLVLSTEIANATAQASYERTDWKRDSMFCVYQLAL
jgi:hypothetical protein